MSTKSSPKSAATKPALGARSTSGPADCPDDGANDGAHDRADDGAHDKADDGANGRTPGDPNNLRITGRTPRVLPRGRHAASRKVVEESQRIRLVEAMAKAVASKGYASTSVADVLALAGVSRKSFYEHFANKEECFVYTYDQAVEMILDDVTAATVTAPGMVEAAVEGTRAYLNFLSTHPEMAWTFLIEVVAAGTLANSRRTLTRERFAKLFADLYSEARADQPDLPTIPHYRFQALVGANDELICIYLREHGRVDTEELLDAIIDLDVALTLGSEVVENLATRQ